MSVAHERIMTAEQEDELMELRSEARDCEADYERKAAVAKTSKKVMEDAQAAVNAFLDDLGNPTPRLKFSDDNGHADPLAGDGPSDAEPVPVAPNEDGEDYAIQADDERWKMVRFEHMAEFGIKPGDVAKLEQAYPPLETMGDLVTWMAGSEHRRLTDLDGIGEATADRISDAMLAYHQANHRVKSPKAPSVPHNETSGEVDRLDVQATEGVSREAPGDSTVVAAGSSDNAGLSPDKKPRRRRKADPVEPSTDFVLPLDPEQAEQDRLDQMHTEAGRPDSVEDVVNGFELPESELHPDYPV